MTRRDRAQLDRIAAAARRDFPHAHMSDTKWRKLFEGLAAAGVELRQMVVKFIDVAEPKVMAFPAAAALHPPRPWIDTIEFGPVELRSIEWLEIPAVARWRRADNLPAREIAQDVGAAAAALHALGRFPIQSDAKGLRILGYSR